MPIRLHTRLVNSYTNNVVLIPFKFVGNGTSQPTFRADVSDGVDSVARFGVGVYSITLNQVYHDILCNVTIENNVIATNLIPKVANAFVDVGNFLVATAEADGTPGDLDNGDTIHGLIFARK